MTQEDPRDQLTLVLIDLEHHNNPRSTEENRELGFEAIQRCSEFLKEGNEDAAEREARGALRYLVDAFLGSREANQSLFELAHRLGAEIEQRWDCPWTPGEDEYTLSCPIYALHRPFAHSLELTATTACSICDAEAFACEHVPGCEYGGEVCRSRVTGIARGAIAFTADPEFVYTWHQPQSVRREQLMANGTLDNADADIYCTHCHDCSGQPEPGDLDPMTRFEKLRRANGGY